MCPLPFFTNCRSPARSRLHLDAGFAWYVLLTACFLFDAHCAFPQTDDYARQRDDMVRYQIAGRGVADPAVLSAMRKVPRHEFVPAALRGLSYEDFPLPISEGQTISQPYIVALMSELARIKKTDRVLEIGAGSGYQAAVLGELAKEVYTMEIVDPLARAARETLQRLGYANVFVKSGDGYRGWPEHAPFDAVIVTAAPEKIPQHLVEQLKTGGRMVLPLGSWSQELIVVTKEKDGVRTRSVIPVRFVPMTGEVEGSKR